MLELLHFVIHCRADGTTKDYTEVAYRVIPKY